MSIPQKNLAQNAYFRRFTTLVLWVTAPLLAAGLAAALGASALTFAADHENDPIHFSAQRTLWDRKANIVQLFGKAIFNQPGETIQADYIHLDQNTRIIDAKGGCVYTTSEMVMYSDEMHLDLETRTGYLIGGKVANERFSLTGAKIFKLGPVNYRAEEGTYTTCHDCPQSWMMTGEEIDMEIEGYAFMKNVTTRIKDAPFLWLPYLVVPMKRNRQTGFLFPKFGFFNGGFTYSAPFFWAINRSVDMTIAPGNFAGRGTRFEYQARYKLSQKSGATLNFFYLKDKTFLNDIGGLAPDSPLFEYQNRYAFEVQQFQELPFRIDQKLRLLESSDNRYPNFVGDIPGRGESVLASSFSLSRSTDAVSAYVYANRYRNLLFFDGLAHGSTPPDGLAQARSNTLFDIRTVQVAPAAIVTTKDRFLFDSPVAAGLTVGVSNFTRGAGAFDQLPAINDPLTPADPNLPIRFGQDPIREATRFSLTPTVYTTLRPFKVLSLTPQAEYRGYFYSFQNNLPSTTRGYLLLRGDLMTQFEKIYETDDPGTPRVKHLIRPLLSYSLIPVVNESSTHPFIQQMQFARQNGISGLNFDNHDIVPLSTSLSTANYFVPLGNSLTYGLTTQLIQRKGAIDQDYATYRRSLEFKAGQTFNFRDLQEDGGQKPFSRLFASVLTQGDKIITSTDYFYYPYISLPRNQVTTSMSYVFKRGINHRIYQFDRSLSFGYTYNFSSQNSQTSNLRASTNFSINDYLMPSGYVSYDFVSRQMQDMGFLLRVQSPSQCWRFDFGFRQFLCPRQSATDTGYCVNPTVDFSLNLAGAGFPTTQTTGPR